MKNMAKQMELFEPVERGFEEGGLMDEGGTVDPVSGNDVPPGSTQEEVRDDVPAQLSEGEFVFPADVVRYIGLEKLMRMRQEAKMGLAAMEAMGQMGNSEEAVMPDDLPFDMYDLDIEEEDEYNMARGGVVKMQQGGTTYTPPTVGGYVGPPPVTTGFSGPQPVQPFQSGQGQFQVAGAAEGAVTPKTSIQGVTPTFSDFVGMNVPGVDFKMVTFYDENGQAKVLKQFPDGSYEDPANPGVKVSPTDMGLTQEMKTEVTPIEQRVQTAQVRDDDGGKEDGPQRGGTKLGWGGRPDRNKPGVKTGVTMVDFSVLDMPGALPGTVGTIASSLNNIGKDMPDNAQIGISIDGVTTTISGSQYNTAKKGVNGVAYTGKLAEDILDRAQVNAATVNAAISRYGISKSQYQNKTIEDFMETAARSDTGIAELAKDYGIEIDNIKDNPFGFGKNYNDAVAKAVEKANKGYKGDDPFTADDIKDGHAARTEAKARSDALAAKAERARQDAEDRGDDSYGGAGSQPGDMGGEGGAGNVGDAAAAERGDEGYGDAGYD